MTHEKVYLLRSPVEPPELDTVIFCACCPKKVKLLTRTYVQTHSAPETYLELWPGRQQPFCLSEFTCGLFLKLNERVAPQTGARYVEAVAQKLTICKTPHQQTAYLLPDFEFAVGKSLWICQRCKDGFHSYLPEIQAYLARRNNEYSLRFFGS